MNRLYLIAAFAILIISASFLVFYIKVSKKTYEEKNQIKKVSTFNEYRGLEAPTDPFGKLQEGDFNKVDFTDSDANTPAFPKEEKQELKPLYELEIAAVDTAKLGHDFVWVEKSSGHILGKDNLNDLHQSILSKSRIGVVDAIFTKDFVIRRYLDNDFTLRHEAIDKESKEVLELNQNIKECKAYKENIIICSRSLEGKTEFVKTDLDKEEDISLYTLPLEDLSFDYKGDKLFVAQKGSKYKDSVLLEVDKDGKTHFLLKVRALSFKISKDGKKILYTDLKDGKIKTYVKDLENSTTFELPLSTLADKCDFNKDSDKILCAVPQKDIKDFDKYYSYEEFSSDDFYIIDLKDESMEKLEFDNKVLQDLDADNLSWNTDKYASFINRLSGKAWGISLRGFTEDTVASSTEKAENSTSTDKNDTI